MHNGILTNMFIYPANRIFEVRLVSAIYFHLFKYSISDGWALRKNKYNPSARCGGNIRLELVFFESSEHQKRPVRIDYFNS